MSFGFSVGDIITVGNLIADIINSLREAGGSKSEYQEVIRELETLDGVLKHIDQLKPSRSPSGSLDSIKYAALSCRQPLEQFLGKIRKYENGLGVWEKRRGLGLAKDKLQWALGHKKEIGKLQSYLYIHIGTINMLLAEHGLERMDIISENIEADSLHVRERLDGTRSIMQYIKDSVTAQAAVIRTTHVMLAKMFQMVSGELTTSLATLGDTVAKMCVTTQQIHGVVLDIRDSLGAVDTRWTFFQAPLAIEDALGFKFPFLSEYDYGYLEVILKHRFLEGPGSLAVKDGNYEVFATRNSAQIISEDVRLRPGTALTMAILVAGPIFDEECPMPHCHSSRTSLIPDGGRIWSVERVLPCS
ncbi:uncharacterized protein BDZ99DRAFT_394265 [Mytilinidion resinicola]|uniref:Fungal N-terminal domain-containing protein n=1 Tax=Mytilinidion resinicola TaxID=574789 RepID=A0A6A6YEK8_9PEZI|nr:uncharacterized protein BDZ99DRAFT_394265 [Mytilinidion resinicola]KAF2806515.1 hypothetical protein BDZ99DRAFT_394265 [Mytilinidion resinicola]